MRTLFLNPPSFEGFDGGASSRWPATREIESYWYPVWLCYPAGMLPDSKVVDAPPHKISIEQTVQMAKDFELLVLFTSTPGFDVDVKNFVGIRFSWRAAVARSPTSFAPNTITLRARSRVACA